MNVKLFIYTMIALGIAIMITNIYRYIRFMKGMKDVLSTGHDRDKAWMIIGLLLLVFFLIGYIFIGGFSNPDIVMGGVLFGGSIFVAIVLTLMFHLIASVKENCLSMTEVLVGMIEARDPNLNGHSRFVQNLTMLFYSYLPSEMRKKINPVSLEYAALLHDVGKLGIPENILNKPAGLSDEEWQVMRNHPQLGVDFLRPLTSFEHIRPWIKYHHERMDGTGYYRLPGSQIPLPARIIAIADTYSAITMRRAYKEPKTHEMAMEIIQSVAGSQLDAELVGIFARIPKAELVACVPPSLDYIMH